MVWSSNRRGGGAISCFWCRFYCFCAQIVSLSERPNSAPDESLLIVARHGTAGSIAFLSAAGALFAYAEWLRPVLRMVSFCQLSVIWVILTGLKWKLWRERERVRRQIDAEARLKDALGSAEFRCIRTRDAVPRGRRSPRPDLEWDASGTLRNLEVTKDVELVMVQE
ncbi:hypothetical protein BJ741DRAFT_607772 [Chytriomyces cf. hyalinus JEL632]|nr:hypothetical protein BJ741DRAFT_607772 [Chytriomyces cf. hyalinus JEL632]